MGVDNVKEELGAWIGLDLSKAVLLTVGRVLRAGGNVRGCYRVVPIKGGDLGTRSWELPSPGLGE